MLLVTLFCKEVEKSMAKCWFVWKGLVTLVGFDNHVVTDLVVGVLNPLAVAMDKEIMCGVN